MSKRFLPAIYLFADPTISGSWRIPPRRIAAIALLTRRRDFCGTARSDPRAGESYFAFCAQSPHRDARAGTSRRRAHPHNL